MLAHGAKSANEANPATVAEKSGIKSATLTTGSSKQPSQNMLFDKHALGFQLFGMLPPELRRMIWKIANLQRLGGEYAHVLSLTALELPGQHADVFWDKVFKVDKRIAKLGTSAELFQLGLSIACVESRQVYMEELPIRIPVNSAVVRIHDGVLVHLSYPMPLFYPTPTISQRGPEWFAQIKSLSIPEPYTDSFIWAFFHTEQPAAGKNVVMDLLKQFPNLDILPQEIMARSDDTPRIADNGCGEVEILLGALVHHKWHRDPAYKIPQLRTVKECFENMDPRYKGVIYRWEDHMRHEYMPEDI